MDRDNYSIKRRFALRTVFSCSMMVLIMDKNKTSWGKVADWYDNLLDSENTYQNAVILPNLLRLLNIKKGDKILDVACGQGFFAHEFAQSGAVVHGVDISSELVALAKTGASSSEKFFTASADDLGKVIKEDGFDKAVIVLALQNIENLNGTLAQVYAKLKTGGKFYIILNHPAFRIPKRSDWGFDEVNNIQYRRVDSYLSESKEVIDMHPGQKKKEFTISFHRPLQVYFKAFGKAGFVVTRLEEWESHKKSSKGPRQKAEDQSRKEIPIFMMIECEKR